MSDNRTKEQRSYNMSRIRSKNTKPEIVVRRFLFKKGFRYRLHSKSLTGKPDIILRKHRTVIFVHGCFWHGHSNCKNSKTPVANRKFWIAKITNNSDRDKKNSKILQKEGWRILVLWECELTKNNHEKTLNKLMKCLLSKN